MAILNAAQLAGVLVDLWINIITWFSTTAGNYALAVIMLTIILKLAMTPLDFFNKKVTRKNAQMQKKMQPQLDKLKQKYGHDNNLYNQKMSELYKNNNYNVVGSCLFMIVNLVVTFTIFISLLNGLNQMAATKISEQYTTLQTVYQTQIDDGASVEDANAAVVIKYDEIKNSFLWINNIWKSDTITNSIPTFDEYVNVARVEFEDDAAKESAQTEYQLIMDPLREASGTANGYYILLIAVVGTSVLSQWLMQRKMGSASEGNPAAGTGKMMMFILPVLLGYFALSATSVFALYLVTNQIISIGTTPIIDKFIDKSNEKEENQKQLENQPEYSRVKTSDSPFYYEREEDKKSEKKKNIKGEK